MPGRAEVVYFPKKCPTCSSPMKVVNKLSGAWWFECPKCVENEADEEDPEFEDFIRRLAERNKRE